MELTNLHKMGKGKYICRFLVVLFALFFNATLPAQDFSNQLLNDATKGDADAQYALATAYYYGNNVAVDKLESFRWTNLAAKRGHAFAQYTLGWHYDTGTLVSENQPQASYWYRLAAEQGVADAQASLGRSYFYGYGVDKDWEKSAIWLKRAADQGHAEAKENLAILAEKVNGLEASERRLINAIIRGISEAVK